MSDMKRKGYRLQRSASLGAGVTLVSGCGEYSALFECAAKCAEVLGNRQLEDLGDGILDIVPSYKIPIEELNPALQKLSKRFSIALVEYVSDRMGGRFVALWRINASAAEPAPTPPSTNLDDY